MENPVGHRHRLPVPDRATPRRLTQPTGLCPPAIPGLTQGTPRKLVQPSRSRMRHYVHAGRAPSKPTNDRSKSPIHGFRLSGATVVLVARVGCTLVVTWSRGEFDPAVATAVHRGGYAPLPPYGSDWRFDLRSLSRRASARIW
jgi:hypothetical protein